MTQAILFTTFVLGVLMILFFEGDAYVVFGSILVISSGACFTLIRIFEDEE